MLRSRTTLTQYLIEERRQYPDAEGDFNALILDIALACKAIARQVAQGSLDGGHGVSGEINIQGETQQKLDVLANEAFLRATEWGGVLSGMVSEELPDLYPIPSKFARGKYLMSFDPLDGSSNIDVNVSVGSIFSITESPHPGEPAEEADFFQPGTDQLAAGYAIYGPCTMLVLTLGRGVYGFTLDQSVGEFFLTHPEMKIPPQGHEFAINSSNRRHWEPAIRRYVDECLAGRTGVREKDFNMRWVASLVAETHRILTRGGVFLYPRDATHAGRLRLLYEAAPISFIVEQAGGRASTGESPIADIVATSIHERVGFVFGAADEVDRIERYHAEPYEDPDGTDLDLPLYAVRGLFRASH